MRLVSFPRVFPWLRTAALLLAAALIVPAAAYGQKSSAPATVVHIFGVDSLTGPSAPYGIRKRNGAAIAVAQINDAGGVTDAAGHRYTFELSQQDMANDRSEAIALIRQAAADPKNLVVMGPTNSVGFLPMVPVAAEEKIVMIGTNLAPTMTWNAWTFRSSVGDRTSVPAMLKILENKIHFKRLAIMYDETQDNLTGAMHLAEDLAKDIGYQVVANQAFRTGAENFLSQISTIKAANPDAIFMPAATGDGPHIVLQMRAAGIKVPLLTNAGSFVDPIFWDNAQGGVKGDYTYLNGADLANPNAAVKKFLADYNKQFSANPATVFSLYGYDAVYAIAAAVKKSGSATDRAKLQQAMHDLDVTSPIGDRVKFSNPPTGDNLSGSVRVIQVTGRGTYTEVGRTT